MRRPVVGFTLLFLLAGCGSVIPDYYRAETAARYGEMAGLLEQRVSSLDAAPNLELISLCKAYGRIKDYGKLSPCLEELDRRIARGDDSMTMSLMGVETPVGSMRYEAYLVRAQAALELGDYAGALRSAQDSYDFIGGDEKRRNFLIETLRIMGTANALLGETAMARANLAELDALGTGFPYTLLASPKANAMASVSMALGEYATALKAMDGLKTSSVFKALASGAAAAVVQVGDMFSFEELPRAFLYSRLQYETGQVDDARRGYDRLLAMPRVKDNGEIYWMLLADRARIAIADGDPVLALDLFRESIDVIERQRATISSEVGKIGFVGDKQQVYDELVRLLFSRDDVALAFEYAERSKARALVDMLAARESLTRVARAPREDLVAMLREAQSNVSLQDERATSADRERQRAIVIDLRDRITHADPELASLVTVDAMTAADVQAKLNRDETLVEYYGSDNDLIAFVISNSGIAGVAVPVPNLRQSVATYRELLMQRDGDAHMSHGYMLYARLFEPLLPHITTSKLTVVGHGPIHYLPVHALFDGSGYLVDRYAIQLLPSASVLAFLQPRERRAPRDLLAFGNPDLGDPALDLPGAQFEVEVLRRDRAGVTALLRDQATETALRKFGGEFNTLHFATHGVFDATEPLSSRLLLAADSENDGILTVAELYTLYLPAELVSLSACETALGEVAFGDDVVGFTRGFLFAGVESIVSSLWAVDDEATAALMQSFYQNLASMDVRQALRAGMRRVRDDYNDHPYYWAAFQVTGLAQ